MSTEAVGAIAGVWAAFAGFCKKLPPGNSVPSTAGAFVNESRAFPSRQERFAIEGRRPKIS
jgi:hypothetical protein